MSSDPPNKDTGTQVSVDVETTQPLVRDIEPVSAADLVGTRVAGYDVLELLGSGGMADVYRVMHVDLQAERAMKLIRREFGASADFRSRFQLEAQAVAKLDHPNIVSIYDFGAHNGSFYMVMQLIEGEELRDLLRREQVLEPEVACQLIAPIVQALAYAHSRNLIHRDIKPDNIMIDRRGRPILMDFGIAKLLTENSQLTQTGLGIGTPAYMAPEQAQGKTVSPATDLYALTIVFYELVTGKKPFTADSPLALMMKAATEPVPPPREINPSISDALQDFLLKGAEKDPLDRYQTGDAYLQALDEVFDNSLDLQSATVSAIALRQPVEEAAKTRWIPIAVGLAIAAVALLSSYLIVDRAPGVEKSAAGYSAAAPLTVLIADFVNNTDDSLFQNTLEEALQIGLEGASFISVFPRAQARSGIEDGMLSVENARLAATRAGVQLVVTGSINTDGDGYLLKVQGQETLSGEERFSITEEVDDKLSMLGEIGKISEKARKRLGDVDIESNYVAETLTATTLEAASHYFKGQELQANWQLDEAIAEYGKALSIDPDMGRAYSGLGVCYAYKGKAVDAKTSFDRAISLSSTMTEREALRTMGNYHSLVSKNLDLAVEQYKTLIEKYPAEPGGLNNLAAAQLLSYDFAAAIESGRNVLKIYPEISLYRGNMALYLMYGTQFEEAAEISQALIDANDSYTLGYLPGAIAALDASDPERAIRIYDVLSQIGSAGASKAAEGLADAALYEGQPQKALELLRGAISADKEALNEGGVVNKQLMQATANIQLGDEAAARDAIRDALERNTDVNVKYLAADLFLAMGDPAEVKRLLDLGETKLDTNSRMLKDIVDGRLAFAGKDYAGATDLFERSLSRRDNWISHYWLGRTYLAADANLEAVQELRRCIERRGEASALFLDEVPSYRFAADAYYWLARALEAAGIASSADENYKRYLDIRGDSTTDPQVPDAKKRRGYLAPLEGA